MPKLAVQLVLGCLAALLGPQASAQTPTDRAGWSGTLGGGVVAFPKYTGGKSMQALLLPIAYVEYDGWFYVNLFRVGAYVWSSQDKKQGLSLVTEPRIGFKSGDGPRLAGMATRRSTLFGGLAYNAENDLGSMSLAYFADLGNASRGGYTDLLFERPLLKNQSWDLSAAVEFSRLDSRVVNYYFGVTPAEAAAGRPVYTSGATNNVTLWLTGQYNLSKQHALMFGANVTRLGSAAASSPIVERRDVPFLYFGFGVNL